MQKTVTWHKEMIDGKWFCVADREHIPLIECCKDGNYKIRNKNGKAVINRNFNDAVKIAMEIYRQFTKYNRKFDRKGSN